VRIKTRKADASLKSLSPISQNSFYPAGFRRMPLVSSLERNISRIKSLEGPHLLKHRLLSSSTLTNAANLPAAQLVVLGNFQTIIK
jgi:hypothetical protein